MGAIFRARTYELTKDEFIDLYKEFKIKNLFITDMKGDNLFETKIKTPCGIVIGNEGNGVSKEMRELSNGTVSIPMVNNLESLNASVAGSIIMFKIAISRYEFI
jgi:23S rRNA (guanosine2251-2'-O)-methyltransferase